MLDEFEVLEIVIDKLESRIEFVSLEDDSMMVDIDMTVERDLIVEDK